MPQLPAAYIQMRKGDDVSINLPGELAWVLNMLGYDWPEIDEDEVRRGAGFTRDFKVDLEGALLKADSTINDDFGSIIQTGAATSLMNAWDENKSSNITKMYELLDPAATAMDLFAAAVEGLKIKVIAELVITAAQLAIAAATAFVTAGASAAANAAIMFARKKALDFVTNVIIEQLIGQILEMVIEPLSGALVSLANRVMDAPLTQGMIGDPREYRADLAALETAASDLDTNATDQERITQDYVSSMTSLQIVTG